jgi:hypothetical protein
MLPEETGVFLVNADGVVDHDRGSIVSNEGARLLTVQM